MATITPTAINTAGQQPTFVSANSGGDVVAVGLFNTKTTLVVRNGSGSTVTVTLTGAVNCSQGFTHNITVSCPANADTDIVLAATTVNPTTGQVAVGYSSVTSVTVAAIQ